MKAKLSRTYATLVCLTFLSCLGLSFVSTDESSSSLLRELKEASLYIFPPKQQSTHTESNIPIITVSDALGNTRSFKPQDIPPFIEWVPSGFAYEKWQRFLYEISDDEATPRREEALGKLLVQYCDASIDFLKTPAKVELVSTQSEKSFEASLLATTHCLQGAPLT